MPFYRISTSLKAFKGKSGKTYHATKGALIEAPEGEFEALGDAVTLVKSANAEKAKTPKK